MEASVYDYYGWSPYWTSGFYMGGYAYGYGYGAVLPGQYLTVNLRGVKKTLPLLGAVTMITIFVASRR
jgi:hypothetical protein